MSDSKKDFFISYNSADKNWAEWVAWQLEDAGYTVEIQAWDFKAGSNFVIKMQEATSKSKKTIAVISPEYLNADFTQPEWASAFVQDPKGENRILIPILVKDTNLEGLFKSITYIDLRGLEEISAKNKLLEEIKEERKKPNSCPLFPDFNHSISSPPAFPNALPAIWNVPFNQNISFTGREDILNKINEVLSSNQSQVVIYGLGGVGKTSIVLEYIYRNLDKYNLVWWIRSEKEEIMSADITQLARKIGFDIKNTDIEDIIENTRQWLSRNTNWLIIFDNLNNSEFLKEYIPQGKIGHVIVTSQNSIWDNINSMPLEIFERKESIEFITKKILGSNNESANILAETLGDLPLALNQAISYINAQKIEIDKYVEKYNSRGIELLNKPKSSTHTIQTTWDLAFNEIGKDCSEALSLLGILAFLSPESIPKLIIDKMSSIKNDMEKPLYTEEKLEDIIEILQKYSFIKIDNEFISIHRLLQSLIREKFEKDNIEDIFLQFFSIFLSKIFDIDTKNESQNIEQISEYESFFPHILCYLEYCKSRNKVNIISPGLLQLVSIYLKFAGNFKKAEEYLLWKVSLARQFYSNNPIALASILSEFAGFSLHFSKNKEAMNYLEEAVQILTDANMRNTRYMYAAKATLIRPYAELGNFNSAIAIIEEISDKTNLFDPDIYNIFLHNTALVYLKKKDFEKAEYYLSKAIENNLEQECPNIVNIGTSYANLSNMHMEKGDYLQAKIYAEKAMETYKTCYSNDHPYVLGCLEKLIDICYHTNEIERKLELSKNLLKRTLNSSNKDNDQLISAYGYIIEALIDHNDYLDAIEYCKTAVLLAKETLGKEDIKTICLVEYYQQALKGYAFSQNNQEIMVDCFNQATQNAIEFNYWRHLPVVAVPEEEIDNFKKNNSDCKILDKDFEIT